MYLTRPFLQLSAEHLLSSARVAWLDYARRSLDVVHDIYASNRDFARPMPAARALGCPCSLDQNPVFRVATVSAFRAGIRALNNTAAPEFEIVV